MNLGMLSGSPFLPSPVSAFLFLEQTISLLASSRARQQLGVSSGKYPALSASPRESAGSATSLSFSQM